MQLTKAEPLYLKLKKQLKQLIDKHDLKVLPSAKELEKRFGVSRITVRRAVAELCEESVLTSTQGRKVMVTRHMHENLKEFGFIISEKSSWTNDIYLNFANEAMNQKCDLNMFIAGAKNDIMTNSLFTFLLDSNKFSSLLIISKQSSENIRAIQKKNIPIITYNIKYKNLGVPAALFSYKKAISDLLDFYLAKGMERFGFITMLEANDDIAYGTARIFTNDYKEEIRKRGLIDYDFPKHVLNKVEGQKHVRKLMQTLYNAPEEERPQVLISCYNYAREAIADFLDEKKDWNPVQICVNNAEDNSPHFISPSKELANAVFCNFLLRINDDDFVPSDIYVDIIFDKGK